ncbi:MAG TPA: hypothetical protein VG940_10260 [Gemmatimonadales bacterium]|nr:hypothetical protein [Gemmatimonadales bacterium]
MRLFFLSYAGSDPDRIARRLDAGGVPGHTRLAPAHGHGLTGPREGTRVWPGEVTVFTAVVPDDRATALADLLRAESATLPIGERLHVAVLPVEEFF